MKKVINVSGAKIEIIKNLAKAKNCFMYLDPPYYPTAKNKYGKITPYNLYNSDYTPVDFLKLKVRCDELTNAKIPFLLSSSDCDFIRILFRNYVIVEIQEPRGMKKANSEGKKPKEKCLIITNFKNKTDFIDGVKQLNKLSTKK